MLYTVHSVAASLTKLDMLRIPKSACSELSAAILEVSELYEIPMVDEKSLAWMNLAAVVCKVYIFNGKAVIETTPAGDKKVTGNLVDMPDFMKGPVM